MFIVAFLLSFGSGLYAKLMPPEILPWGGKALPWHLEDMFPSMFYMFLGYLFRKKYEFYFDEFEINKKKVPLLVVYLFFVYVPYALTVEIPMILDIFYTYYLCRILGVVLVVAFSKELKPNRYIEYVGQNTLICFALHGKILSIIEHLLKKFLGSIYSTVLGSTLISSRFSLCFSIAISVILILPVYIINRWFPWILGREKVSVK